jgi:RNA polymerase sigma factor for flagellar operon FliA
LTGRRCARIVEAIVTSGPESAPAKKPVDPPDVLARVREGLDLVDVLARHLQRRLGPATPLDELRSGGNEALLLAARSYDPARGVPFRRWAALRIKGAMFDAMRAHGALPRRVYRQLRALETATLTEEARLEEDAAHPPRTPEEADTRLTAHLASLATSMTLSLLSTPEGDELDHAPHEQTSPEEQLAREELRVTIRECIAELPDAERQILEGHFYEDLTIDQTAARMGLSKSWGCRLHARAVEMVARALLRRRALGP